MALNVSMEGDAPLESSDRLQCSSPSNAASADSSTCENPACGDLDLDSPPLLSPWGFLHGKPCTLEEYLEISVSDSGKYDLIDGRLQAREMPNAHHDELCNLQKTLFDLEKTQGEQAFVDASIAIREGASSPAKYRYRTPDFSVGTTLTDAQRAKLPLTCRDVTWTEENPPRLVGEVTSHNKSTDLNEKTQDYAKAKVPRYMITHRDMRNGGRHKDSSRIHYGRLEGSSYNFTTYERDSNDKVGSPGPLHHKPEVLLDPKQLKKIVEMKEMQAKRELQRERNKRIEAVEERKKVEERERREREERKKAEERERREREERKKVEERERREREERKKAEERERREREERKKAEERERREREERKKAEERERREREDRKKAEKRAGVEKRKRKSLKDRLRQLGEPVSDSSSGSCSPPRKK